MSTVPFHNREGKLVDALSERFDKLLATMQTPEAKAGVAAAFDATPNELGAAAVKAARTVQPR
jgi:antitoxin Phd